MPKCHSHCKNARTYSVLIVSEFKRMKKDVMAVPAVLCKNHGPVSWGKDAKEAVHNAVVLEEVAKMAYRTTER